MPKSDCEQKHAAKFNFSLRLRDISYIFDIIYTSHTSFTTPTSQIALQSEIPKDPVIAHDISRPETSVTTPASHTSCLSFRPGCSHFARNKAMFHAPTSAPKQIPCNIPAAIAMQTLG